MNTLTTVISRRGGHLISYVHIFYELFSLFAETFTKASSEKSNQRSKNGVSWLSSKKLSSVVSQSMNKLVEKLDNLSESKLGKENITSDGKSYTNALHLKDSCISLLFCSENGLASKQAINVFSF